MRKCLCIILVAAPYLTFAQRFDVTEEEGQQGLLIFGSMILVLVLVTVFLYVRQRSKDK